MRFTADAVPAAMTIAELRLDDWYAVALGTRGYMLMTAGSASA